MGDNKIKTIAISGASGFVGTHLGTYFEAKGMEIIPLSRKHFTDEGEKLLKEAVERADAVINLAGAPINHRWTDKYKEEMYTSRINTTRRLVDAIAASAKKPKVFFSTSAVGYYSSTGCNTENEFTMASGFLAGLCETWEKEAMRATPYLRTVIMRFGVVMGTDGGVLPILMKPAKAGVATVFGSGTQDFPWIDVDDIAGATEFIMGREDLSGAFNFTSPETVTNREFIRDFARAKHTRLTVRIPSFVFKTALGEAASFILTGQCVRPERLLDAGYRFLSPDPATLFGRVL